MNNVLCFPFIFRGALDVGATTITRPMEIAAVHAIAELARQEQSDIVTAAYGGDADLAFGPRLSDPQALRSAADREDRAGGRAGAAMESGVATRPIEDLAAYRLRLTQFVYHSGTLMQPIFVAARATPQAHSRIVYAEGEGERVLRAVQIAVDEGLANPILVGRPAVIERAIKRYGLRIPAGASILQSSIPSTTTASGTIGRPIASLRRGARRHGAVCQARDAPPDHAHRRDAIAQGARRTG